jgi:hypothetical protein
MGEVRYFEAVNDALDRLHDLGFEFGEVGDLANHGPMGSETLAILGYPDRVARWVDGYHRKPHHERPAPRFAIDADDEESWRPALGRFDRAGDWGQLFDRELAEAPWREVLARWWARLLPGLMASFTHGMIRTAHAVRSISSTSSPTPLQLDELARGLAYWAARYRALPGEARLRGRLSVAEAVATLPRPTLEEGLEGRLAQLHDLQGWDDALDALAPATLQRILSDMTVEFAGVYLAHPEVFPVPLVHGVTAPAAVRMVLPHLPTALHEPSVTAIWHVHTAMLLGFTSDRRAEVDVLARAAETEPPGFTELVGRSVENGDEHVMKFTEACQREYGLRPDPRFPAAVMAAQERIAGAQETIQHL